jgi:hypothetical protein
MTPVLQTWAAKDLNFDPVAHRSTAPDGTDVPHVTRVLCATGVSTDFEGLAQSSAWLQERIEVRRALGTAVHMDAHAADDDDLDWLTVDARVLPFLYAWSDVKENLALVPVVRERHVYHPVHRYTGILDGIFLQRTTGKYILGDLKIGDPADAACDLQTAAYEAAYGTEHPETTIDERWGIQLCPDLTPPYRITNYSDYATRPDGWRDFQKFQSCLVVYGEQRLRRRSR